MASCVICRKPFSFFENLTQKTIQRCKACDQRMKQIQQGVLQFIDQEFHREGVFPQHYQQTLQQFAQVQMPKDLGDPALNRIHYLMKLTEIRYGHIPRIATSIHIDTDEYAHFEMRTLYFKPNKKIKQISGRLIGTNKKCYFISDSGADSVTIDWNNVSQTYEQNLLIPHIVKKQGKSYTTYQDVHVLHLAVSKGSGGGDYNVSDTLYLKTMIDALVRLWKRQLVLYAENKAHGAIPEHVKAAVFQRDKGTCVQCGYSGEYIEYDHIIPRSKGGQNTVENIQLLCRKCNLKKGDRI
jgi:hypothetical protein